MSRLSKLAARSLGEAGFSIGIDDVTPAGSLITRKAAIMADGDARCSQLIELAKRVRARAPCLADCGCRGC